MIDLMESVLSRDRFGGEHASFGSILMGSVYFSCKGLLLGAFFLFQRNNEGFVLCFCFL